MTVFNPHWSTILKRSFMASTFFVGLILISSATWAHDPVFSPGPHVLYKDGVEIATEAHVEKAGSEQETELATELATELVYGLTGDWAAGLELPWVDKKEAGEKSSGGGDITLFTKYRFWRQDTLGTQDSAALLLKVKLDTASDGGDPALGTGTTDTILGLTYGHEGQKWYRWASMRYRHNGAKNGLRRGDKWLFDLAGGIRPTPANYRKPDTVWLLELNGEYGNRAVRDGVDLANTGGMELFLSPGIFWTKRNFAVKAGIQVPIYHDLNGQQDNSDYRAKITLEWHM